MTPIRHKNKRPTKTSTGETRIIGGQWKRTKLAFPLLEGVRPTPSRIRETLFNWLSHTIHQSHCLDLFAGSGALGFEALSRGAKHIWLVDQSKAICRQLTENTQRLATEQASVICANAMQPSTLEIDAVIDVVFCDPPFNNNHLENLLPAIEALKLAENALIYIESEKQLSKLSTPSNWSLVKHKTAGDVRYRLFQRN